MNNLCFRLKMIRGNQNEIKNEILYLYDSLFVKTFAFENLSFPKRSLFSKGTRAGFDLEPASDENGNSAKSKP